MTPNDMKTYDKQDQRLHPLWIIFSVGKFMKEFIIPIVFFFLFKAGSQSMVIHYVKLALILYMIYRFISILLSWWNFKYVFTDKELQINEGRFVKEERFISLDRIQSVQLNTSFVQRLFGLTTLSLHTGAIDDKSTIKLEAISRKEAERIQRHLRLSDIARMDETLPEVEEMTQKHSARIEHYEVTLKEILVASFTSFRFLALIPLLFSLYFKINEFFSLDGYKDTIITFFEKSWFILAIVICIILILSMLFGIGMMYVQYGNFRVASDYNRIFIKKGIFNQTEFSIPKEKVQAIKFNKSLLRRWLGIAEVELISAGVAGEEKIETNVLFPFISEKRAQRLIVEILPTFKIESTMVKLPKTALIVKLMRPSYLWIIAAAVVFYFWPTLWYILLIMLIFIVISRIVHYFHSGYLLSTPYIQLQSGSFSTELFLTTRQKIEELEMTESWLQRKFGLASLKISTRAKPIHVSTISDIPKEMAEHYYHWYANR